MRLAWDNGYKGAIWGFININQKTRTSSLTKHSHLIGLFITTLTETDDKNDPIYLVDSDGTHDDHIGYLDIKYQNFFLQFLGTTDVSHFLPFFSLFGLFCPQLPFCTSMYLSKSILTF